MKVSTADLSPAVRNVTTNPGRGQTPEDCKSAGIESLSATGQSIEPNRWAGFIAVINVNADAGAVGRNVVANALEPASFYEHEMLHVMGQFNHSHNLPNDITLDHVWGLPVDLTNLLHEYNDPWDIMSYDIGLFSYQTGQHGETGPTLNNAYRSLLGWLPAARTATLRVRTDSDRKPLRLTLAPVSEPQTAGPLLAVVDLPNSVRYSVEYHATSGFDRGIPRGEVVVREWRSDGATYLVRQTNGHVGFFPGEPAFTDRGNRLKISVESIAAGGPSGTSATINIDPTFQIPPPHTDPVACSVFNDGNSRMTGRSEAIFFGNNASACIPDGTATGSCRKWFGNCVASKTGETVTFKVFGDGNSSASNTSGAVYSPVPQSSCVPDGSASGSCRKWFGLAATPTHAVECYLFDDGLSNWVGPSEAIFYGGPGKVCMPDGTATGTCRKWFGNCQVTLRPVQTTTPPPSPARLQCLKDCAGERNACMADVGTRGGPRPQQCSAQFNSCNSACPRP